MHIFCESNFCGCYSRPSQWSWFWRPLKRLPLPRFASRPAPAPELPSGPVEGVVLTVARITTFGWADYTVRAQRSAKRPARPRGGGSVKDAWFLVACRLSAGGWLPGRVAAHRRCARRLARRCLISSPLLAPLTVISVAITTAFLQYYSHWLSLLNLNLILVFIYEAYRKA